MFSSTLQIATRRELFEDDEEVYGYDEQLLGALDEMLSATLETDCRALEPTVKTEQPASDSVGKCAYLLPWFTTIFLVFRLLSTTRRISLLPKPLPPSITRPPECEDSKTAAKTRRRWAKAAAVDAEWVWKQATQLPPPFRSGRVLHVEAVVFSSNPAVMHVYRPQEPRKTRPPVAHSQLQHHPYGSGMLPTRVSGGMIPSIEVKNGVARRKKRTRHSRGRIN
ncbi:hypothetical protein C8F01DRAFT_1170430 [Mycena amicta]|nr:hypothetical protein C8F01DRAFT_1170430 [Mycena amicta]